MTSDPTAHRRRKSPSKRTFQAVSSTPSASSQLVTAIRRNDYSTFSSILLESPALNVNRRTPEGDAPLVEICRYARLDMATLLVTDYKADVNVTSSNKSANRMGLTPLIAACMALESKLVTLLLSQSQKKVNLLKTYGRVNAATVCLLFCVANGRTDEQNDTALQILHQLLQYAKQHSEIERLVTAKPDKVNSLVHVAAGLSNWKALKMLRHVVEVDFQAHNAANQSVLCIVETNAFHARSLHFCEPPRPDGDDTNRGKREKKRKSRKKRIQKNEIEEKKQETRLEEQSEAEKQTFSRSRPARAEEAFHVTQTVMELAKSSGVGALFSRNDNHGLRGLYLQALVLAEVGIIPMVNEIAEMSDLQKEKQEYLHGLMDTVVSVYPLSIKNPKEYASLWRQALEKTRKWEDVHSFAVYQNDEEEKKKKDSKAATTTDQHTMELSPAAFHLIVNRMLSPTSLSKRIKVWTLVLMHLLTPFASGSPLTADKRPRIEECSLLSFYQLIARMIYRSGTKLVFCIFDRTGVEEEECFEEELEFHLLLSLVECFFQFFAPFARTIREQASSSALGIAKSFQCAIQPIKELWHFVTTALTSLDDAIATPQRFSLLLHLFQVIEQLEAALIADEDVALVKLFEIVDQFVKREARKKRIKTFAVDQTYLLRTIATCFPIPTTFIDTLMALKNSVDILIRSDPKVLGMDFYSFALIPALIRLEHKVDYLAMLAEEHTGSVSISINRASEANYVEFIVQQLLSTSVTNLKGEMNITLVNEPGVGVGVTREFFQIVQKWFLNPDITEKNTPLQGPSIELQDLLPLFEYVDKQARRSLKIAPRAVYMSKQVYEDKCREKSLRLARKDVLEISTEVATLQKLYLCIGRLMGLAIRNHQPLGAEFPLTFWRFMMRDGSIAWTDYCEASDVFKKSLEFVLEHDFDAEPFDMRFEYTTDVVVVDFDGSSSSSSHSFHVIATTSMEMELVEGMGHVQVTNANKTEFVLRRAQQFFFGHELMYYKKLRDGFSDTIRRSDIKLFSPDELRLLVRGKETIDLERLKKCVVYSRGTSSSRDVIERFWQVVETLDHATRSKLLTFWSGSPLPPMFGFESTDRSNNADAASWYIDVDPRMQSSFCPMANTCDRRLILPNYPTSEILKEKLLLALELGSVGYDRM